MATILTLGSLIANWHIHCHVFWFHGFVIKLETLLEGCDSFGIPPKIHFGFMGAYVNLKPKLGICNFLAFQL